MSKLKVHHLSLEVENLAPCKAKMANNKKACCVGVINFVCVKTFGTKVKVDVFFIHTKGEGYLVLGNTMSYGHEGKTKLGHRPNQDTRA